MFPSRFPIPFVIHLLVVGLVLLSIGIAAIALNQPLALALMVFGLQALPELPIVPENPDDGDDEPEEEYAGSGKCGFTP